MSPSPFVIEEYVRWSDVDFAGIIFYGSYVRFFELAETERSVQPACHSAPCSTPTTSSCPGCRCTPSSIIRRAWTIISR
jgi:hypothetical protein